MFDTEFEFFVKNQDALVAKYPGRVLVLHGAEVAADCDSMIEAYQEGNARFGLGAFMIQPCQPGPEAYTVTLA